MSKSCILIASWLINIAFSCYIETQPRYDIAVEAGKDLLIKCTFDESCNTNSSYVRWEVTQRKGYIKTIEKYIEPISRLSALLNLTSVSVEESGTYACWPGSAQYTSNNTNRVKIGYKPLEGILFNCKSFNLDNLTCVWSAKNSIYLDKTRWLLQYKSGGRWKNCAQDNPTDQSCTIGGRNVQEGYPTTLRNLVLNLHGSNRLGNESTGEIRLEHYKIVKLNEPNNVEYKLTSRTARLVWKTPLKEAVNNKSDLFVNYKILYGNNWHSFEFEINNTESVLVDLIPNTKYKLEIRARLQFKLYSNEWSNPIRIQFKTNQTVPDNWRALTSGSFQQLTTDGRHKSIILYFKTLKPHQQNGEKFIYKIFANSDFEPIFTNKSYTQILIDPNKSYKFYISALNNMGETISDEYLVINNTNEMVKPTVNDIVNHENGTYTISWINTKTSNYTIFWCKSENDKSDQEFVHCDQNGLNWIDVECDTQLCRHSITSGVNNYRFAVSAKWGDTSEGIVWGRCIIPVSRRNIPVLKLNIITTVSTGAKVSWDLPCNNKMTTIAGFILYCKEEGDFNEESIRVAYDGRGEFTLYNLTSGATYSLQMSVVTESGEEGERSSVVTIETPSINTVIEELNTTDFIITIGLLIIFGILFGLVIFIYKRFFQKELKMINHIIDHIPCGILNAYEPNKVQYTAARRESESLFSIQLPQTDLCSSLTINSNTSGFISDSLESILNSSTVNNTENETENTTESQETQPIQYVTVQSLVQAPQQYVVVTSDPSTHAPNKDAEAKDKEDRHPLNYIRLESIAEPRASSGYVQAINLNPNVNNNSNPITPYVLVKDIL